VTCGDEACQRKRHAKSCKWWHERNTDSAESHYEDVVKPYRRRHPSYQRRRRIVVALREIRDEMLAAVGDAGKHLAGLVSRGQLAMEDGALETVQVRAMTGKPLVEALAAAVSMLRALDELATLSGVLSGVGVGR
jgi:hypothetical protein